MKKITLVFLLFTAFCYCQVTISPNLNDLNQSITITVDANSVATNCNGFSNPTKVYIHSGVGDNANAFGIQTIGNWGQDDGVGEMASNGDGTWSITFIPSAYYSLSAMEQANVTQMGMVFRNENGSQEFKDNSCADFIFSVGAFQLNLTAPTEEITLIPSSSSILITATTTIATDYNLKANSVSINTSTNTTSYSFSPTVTETTTFVLEATDGSDTFSETFSVIVSPTVVQESIPNGIIEGINYDSGDATKATLAVLAPNKDYVYVIGSFNNYTFHNNYLMKQDTSNTDLYWLEITGLTPNQVYTYQYFVADETPITNSPKFVKTADPYSTLVLSPFDDSGIPSSTYPNLPTYPTGQEREVTVLQTNQTPYNWQVTNFSKPKKEDLIIYELLIRDFDADRNFQDIIDRIDYFKNLNINAIELMPVMEFEGNESWGYNTAFHMALDKFYGTEDKLRELIDVCHQNGIAVILDLVLNHAFGRNPMNRMWMNDPDDDGWGDPSSENPYFNQTAKHSYSVGSDFNHQSTLTQGYTQRVIKHWIEEFKIDGFRWDLTKGFTQNCTSGNETCTNSYQQDRVDVLKAYADYSWSLDETHYVIFEHLGSDSEEQQWANYRIGDAVSKGVMMWSEMWTAYKNLAQGQSSNINFDRMGNTAHGFTEKRTLGYPESHDKDRIMYEMTEFGNGGSGFALNTALERMSALGAVTIPIPGPKMLWHFADLGMDDSIWTCSNGVVNSDYDGNNDGDCKLDTKPQPQWTENWLGNANRNQIYSDWARLNALKINEDVFEGSYAISSGTQTPRVSVYTGNENLPGASLKNVIIIANFSVTSKNINPNFPYTGTWYDLMDNTGSTTVSGSISSVTLSPGAFKIYGNQASTLSINNFESHLDIKAYPNPTSESFQINKFVESVSIFDLTGKQVKTFKGSFNKGYTFNISDLTPSIYLAKINSNLDEQITLKIVKLD